MRVSMFPKMEKTGSVKIIFLLVLVCLSATTCKKDSVQSDPNSNPVTGEIKQPAKYDDPVVLPEIKREIKKLEGNFSPLLTGVIANWKIISAYNFFTSPFVDCWSVDRTTYYDGVTRENIKGKNVRYPYCAWAYSDANLSPNFSAPASSVWGQQIQGEQEIKDGALNWIETGDYKIRYERYYTLPTLPDPYILMERRWEIVPIPGEGDYAYCEGCSSLTKETSTTSGLKLEETRLWGYTLGVEFSINVPASFGTVGAKVSAEFNQTFSTNIQNYEEKTTSITVTGNMPTGKNIMRLQVFREITSFKLVDKDGGDYYPGVYSPEIAITTQTKNYIWYY